MSVDPLHTYMRAIPDSNMAQHLTSGWHRTFTTFCPFCGSSFLKASILMSHLESGYCSHAPGLDHHSILWLVRNCDDTGVIINNQADWLHSGSLDSASPETGEGYKCFTCYRTFQSPLQLQAHLRFPMDHPEARNPRVYRCLDRSGHCDKAFVSLAALFKHLETQSCGTMSFDTVQHMQQQLTHMFWGSGIGVPKR